LVDEQASHDLRDRARDPAANQLPRKRGCVETGRRALSEYRTQHGTAADPADGAGDQVADVAEIGAFDRLASGRAPRDAAQELSKNGFHEAPLSPFTPAYCLSGRGTMVSGASSTSFYDRSSLDAQL